MHPYSCRHPPNLYPPIPLAMMRTDIVQIELNASNLVETRTDQSETSALTSCSSCSL